MPLVIGQQVDGESLSSLTCFLMFGSRNQEIDKENRLLDRTLDRVLRAGRNDNLPVLAEEFCIAQIVRKASIPGRQ